MSFRQLLTHYESTPYLIISPNDYAQIWMNGNDIYLIKGKEHRPYLCVFLNCL